MKNLFSKITIFLLMGTVSGSLFGMEVPANKKPEKTVYKGIVRVNNNNSVKMCLASKYYHMQKFNILENEVDVSIPIVPVHIEIYQEQNKSQLLNNEYDGIDKHILKANIPHFLLLSTLQSNNEFVKEGVIIKQEYPSFTLELMCMDFNKDYSVGRQLSEKFKAFEKQPELANFMWTRDIKFPDKSLDQKSELINAGVIAEETQNGKTVLVHGEKRYRNQLVKNENQVKEDTASLSEIPIKKTEEKNENKVIEGTVRLSKDPIKKKTDGSLCVEIIPNCDGLSGFGYLPIGTSSDQWSWKELLEGEHITMTQDNVAYKLKKDPDFNSRIDVEFLRLAIPNIFNNKKNLETIKEGIDKKNSEKLASSLSEKPTIETKEKNEKQVIEGTARFSKIRMPEDGSFHVEIIPVCDGLSGSEFLPVDTSSDLNELSWQGLLGSKPITITRNNIVYTLKKDANFKSGLETEFMRPEIQNIINNKKNDNAEITEENAIKNKDETNSKDIKEGIDQGNNEKLVPSQEQDKKNQTPDSIRGTVSIVDDAKIVIQGDNLCIAVNISPNPDCKFEFKSNQGEVIVGWVGGNEIKQRSLHEKFLKSSSDGTYPLSSFKTDEDFQTKLEKKFAEFREQREEGIKQSEEQKKSSFAWLKKHHILSFGIGAAAVATGFMYLLYSKSPQYGHGFVKYVSSIVARVPGYNFVTGMMG